MNLGSKLFSLLALTATIDAVIYFVPFFDQPQLKYPLDSIDEWNRQEKKKIQTKDKVKYEYSIPSLEELVKKSIFFNSKGAEHVAIRKDTSKDVDENFIRPQLSPVSTNDLLNCLNLDRMTTDDYEYIVLVLLRLVDSEGPVNLSNEFINHFNEQFESMIRRSNYKKKYLKAFVQIYKLLIDKFIKSSDPFAPLVIRIDFSERSSNFPRSQCDPTREINYVVWSTSGSQSVTLPYTFDGKTVRFEACDDERKVAPILLAAIGLESSDSRLDERYDQVYQYTPTRNFQQKSFDPKMSTRSIGGNIPENIRETFFPYLSKKNIRRLNKVFKDEKRRHEAACKRAFREKDEEIIKERKERPRMPLRQKYRLESKQTKFEEPAFESNNEYTSIRSAPVCEDSDCEREHGRFHSEHDLAQILRDTLVNFFNSDNDFVERKNTVTFGTKVDESNMESQSAQIKMSTISSDVNDLIYGQSKKETLHPSQNYPSDLSGIAPEDDELKQEWPVNSIPSQELNEYIPKLQKKNKFHSNPDPLLAAEAEMSEESLESLHGEQDDDFSQKFAGITPGDQLAAEPMRNDGLLKGEQYKLENFLHRTDSDKLMPRVTPQE